MRRRDEPPLPSAERWLLSWSDFVTLLLALFAAMYAGASVDHVRSDAVARSVGSALGVPVPLRAAADHRSEQKNDSGNYHAEERKRNAAPAGAAGHANGRLQADALRASLAALGAGERVQVTLDGDTVGLDIGAELLFREGDSALSGDARQLLVMIAQLLHAQPWAIRVEGHTDSTPIANERYASNWELSAARAAVVVRQLAASGIAEERMTAVGMAANRALATNASAAGRARNRRVHLVLLPLP